MKTLSHGICLLLSLCLLVVGLSSPLAGAATTSLRIPATALRPQNSSVTFSDYQDGKGMYATSNPTVIWSAPVYLPQGAVITSVRMFYIDNNQTENCVGAFIFRDLIITPTTYANSSSGSSSSVAYVDINVPHTVDSSKYAYTLAWVPTVADTSMVLIGFQIFYTPPPGRAAVIPLY